MPYHQNSSKFLLENHRNRGKMDALHTYMYKWLLTLMDRGYSYRLSLWCLNATFNNISAISCVSLLVEEIWVLGEKSRPAANHWQTLSRNVASSKPRLSGVRTHTLVVIGTDAIGSHKSTFHAITATTTISHGLVLPL